MAIQVTGSVGPAVSSDTDVGPPFRQGRTAELIVSELQARYYENAYRQNIFFGATGAGQTTSIGLATTYVGLILSNPIGNTKNLIPLKVGFAESVITAAVNAVGIGIAYNPSTNVTHTATVTPASTLVGTGPPSVAKLDTSATIPASSNPAYALFLNSTPTATTNVNGGLFDLEGMFIIPPGGMIFTATVAASSAASFWASWSWVEVPV